MRYFTQRKQPVQFTRARAYHKNANAHIEAKNWTHIRQYLGYRRFDKLQLVEKLNELYTTEWNCYFNFFIPSVKLIEKTRVGSKIIKKYDQPKTPVQRLLESQNVSEETKQKLLQLSSSLNPLLNYKNTRFNMFYKMKSILKEIYKI